MNVPASDPLSFYLFHDIGFDFVAFASRRPEFRSLAGVHCHTVPFPGEEPRLPEPVDAILMSDVHALRSPDYETRGRTLLRNLPRELRPGGLVAIHERWVDTERAFSFRELREIKKREKEMEKQESHTEAGN